MAILRIAEAVIGKLAADEVKAWLPLLSQKMLHLAVLRLPEEQRGRYLEEWEAHLVGIPGDFSKLFYSLDQVRAALRIAAIHRSGSAPSAVNRLRVYMMSRQLRIANRVHMMLAFGLLWYLIDLAGVKGGERFAFSRHEKWPLLHQIVRVGPEVGNSPLWVSCLLTICLSLRDLNWKWLQSMSRNLLEANGSQ